MKNILPLFIFAFCVVATSAHASPNKKNYYSPTGISMGLNSYERKQVAEQTRVLSLREIMAIVNSKVAGKLVDANGPITRNGRQIYEITWEPTEEKLRGKIIIFVVDAESGQILSRNGG